jgi:uncharacterized membrane protein YkvA (DUF1232 family)
MDTWRWALLGAAVAVGAYLVLIVGLLIAGRRTDARALATFVPDCLRLFYRLLGDPRVSRSRKLVLGALVGYLAMPFDLVPDFLPVVGQLDDAIIVALALRLVLRAGGPELMREQWPGPEQSRQVVIRLAYGAAPRTEPLG